GAGQEGRPGGPMAGGIREKERLGIVEVLVTVFDARLEVAIGNGPAGVAIELGGWHAGKLPRHLLTNPIYDPVIDPARDCQIVLGTQILVRLLRAIEEFDDSLRPVEPDGFPDNVGVEAVPGNLERRAPDG